MGTFFDTIRRSGFRRGPDRIVGGVCGGIARAASLNVWAVRVLTLVLFLIPGIGIGTYLLAWLLLPSQDGSIPLENLLAGGRPVR
ncbi:PspC domain-containing protein [Georgenia sp. AZ-5]|uniref:PspC domain-containing protein n=1 Tax=Georgenia sp. AZ-5 TaxID=3367526 RepID=UPI003754ECD8